MGTLKGLWQEELWRQKDRLETDLTSRAMGVALTSALFALYLPTGIVFGIYLFIIAAEIANVLLFRLVRRRLDHLSYAALLLNAWAGFCAFSLLGVLVWAVDDPLVKVSGVLSLVGALISVSTSRAEHLPFGIVSGIPPSIALLWIAARGWSAEQGFGNSAFATIAVIGLIGYFGSALVQHHMTLTRLAQALARANAASRAKSRFLSEMNHEMRTPLNTILGLSQTVRGQGSADALSEHAGEIMAAARDLQTLIEDVLDLAAAEEGDIRSHPVTTVLRHEMQALARMLALPGPADHPRPDLHIDTGVPELARLDPLLLRKCVAKAAAALRTGSSDRQPIPVSLDCRLDNAAGTVLVLTLTAKPADARGTPSSAGQRPLATELLDRLAAALKADLRFSPPDALTRTASLRVPFAAVPALPEPVPDRTERRLRALVVDDISTNRFVVVQMLKSLQIDATEAESGASALTVLGAQPVDFILLDMNMPAMNGEQTFRAVRSSRQSWAGVPVIALTADAQAEQRERYLTLGIDGYVAKPVDSRLLWAEIVACVPNVTPTPA